MGGKRIIKGLKEAVKHARSIYQEPKFMEGDTVKIVSVRAAEIREVCIYEDGVLYQIEWPDAQGKINAGFFWEEDLQEAK